MESIEVLSWMVVPWVHGGICGLDTVGCRRGESSCFGAFMRFVNGVIEIWVISGIRFLVFGIFECVICVM